MFGYECRPHVSMLTFHSFSRPHRLTLSHFPSVPLISCSHTISPLLYKNLDLAVYVFRTALLLVEEGIVLSISLLPTHIYFSPAEILQGKDMKQRHG